MHNAQTMHVLDGLKDLLDESLCQQLRNHELPLLYIVKQIPKWHVLHHEIVVLLRLKNVV